MSTKRRQAGHSDQTSTADEQPPADESASSGDQYPEYKKPPEKKEEKDKKGLKTTSQWADELFPQQPIGETKLLRPHRGRWKHEAASALHGWELHRHHENQHMKMSRADYEKALKAAQTLRSDVNTVTERKSVMAGKKHRPLKAPGYVPHDPACSKHASFKRRQAAK